MSLRTPPFGNATDDRDGPHLADPANRKPNDAFKGALMWAFFLSARLDRPLSEGARAGLDLDVKYYTTGGPNEEEKEMLREAAAKLPDDQAELVRKRFFL